jgi:hypothetical protein
MAFVLPNRGGCMKTGVLTLAALMLTGSMALASSSDKKTIVLSNASADQTVSLKATVTRTEYREEYVQETCSRESCFGSHEVCTGSPSECTDDRDCEIVDGSRTCSVSTVCTGGTESCSSEPDCTTDYYDCSGYRSVPYEVFDHSTEAKVRVVLKDAAKDLAVNEQIIVSLYNDSVRAVSNSKASKAVLLASVDTTENQSESAKSLESTITIKAVPVEDIAGPFAGVTLLDVKGGVASLEIPTTQHPELLSVDLKVADPKFLARDREIAKGNIALANAVGTQKQKKTVWNLDLKDIGLDWSQLAAGKYKITAKLKSLLDRSTVVNSAVLPAKMVAEDSVKAKKK